MVTKEGKREAESERDEGIYSAGINRCKITEREMRDSFKCQINTHDWFSLAVRGVLQLTKMYHSELILGKVLLKTHTPNNPTHISLTKTHCKASLAQTISQDGLTVLSLPE